MRLRYLALASAFLVAACSDDDGNGPEPKAQLRLVHAAPGTGNVVLRRGDQTVVQGTAYGAQPAAYTLVDAGNGTYAARLVGGAADLATLASNLKASDAYTMLLVKRAAGPTLVALSDTNTAPAAGKAKLRVVNAAAAAGNLDVYITAPDADIAAINPTVAALQPEKATLYQVIDAANRRVRLTTAGTKTVVLDVNPVTLAAGQVRTVIALEAAAGGNPLGSLTITDRQP